MTPQPDSGLCKAVPALARWKASPLSGSESARARMRRRYLLSGYRPQPLPSCREPVEPPPSTGEQERIGICCSGGGIRSAAFNLGALQALQRETPQADSVLRRADYLAAVSGGSYIAAAFAMVRKASLGGADDDSDQELIDTTAPFERGSPEEQYLRNRCDYLAPDGTSKLYIGWRVVLGLIFNVVALALPLIGATLVLGASVYQRAFHLLVPPPAGVATKCTALAKAATATKPAVKAGFKCDTIPLPTWAWAAPAALVALSIATGLAMMLFWIRHDARRRALETWTTRLLLAGVLLALLTVALPELVALLHPTDGVTASTTVANTKSKVAVSTGAGIVGLLVALSAHLRSLASVVEEDVKKVEGVASKFKALTPKLQRAFAYAVATIVGPLLFYFVIVFTMSLTLANAGSVVHRERLVLAGVGTLALSTLIYLRLDITALSLHHFYKRRLCTAFALRRVLPFSPVRAQARAKAIEAQAQLPTPVDPSQRKIQQDEAEQTLAIQRDEATRRLATDVQEETRGIAMERSYDELTKLSETRVKDWPTLLVCAAANISDPGATPPGRHVTSFTFSPFSVGGPLVGAMATAEYESAFKSNRARARARERDLTLPAAVAMSGAAVAPSMGKKTRRPLTFLLALANVRLGVWVPNPRWVAATMAAKEPTERISWVPRWSAPRASYLIRELFGRNRVDDRYLFVTDGGHYENLGLVELLRRGCTKIYCFDASGGETFAELGDAVALARSELGVEIAIDPTPLVPTPQNASGTESVKEPDVAADIAVKGTFRYSDKTEGVLYYARNVMTDSAPWDVRARHIEDPTFPHDPTTDQLYTDQKFESYRALGERAGERALQLAS
jgi:Patatin-like phospholipase